MTAYTFENNGQKDVLVMHGKICQLNGKDITPTEAGDFCRAAFIECLINGTKPLIETRP